MITGIANRIQAGSNGTSIRDLTALPTVNLVGSTWTIDTNNALAYQAQVVSADATAKTLTLSNLNSGADVLEIGIVMTMTTACAVTFTDTTFVDDAPTFSDGEIWAIALTSLDGGTSFLGKYTQLA